MIRFVVNTLFFSVILIASETTIVPEATVNYVINEIKDNDMKLLIDCKYEKTFLWSKKYSEQQILNELMSSICKSKENEQIVNYGEFKEYVNKISLEKNYKVIFEINTNYKELLEKNQKLNFGLRFEKRNFFGFIDGEKDFTITYLKDAPMNINLLYKINENPLVKKDSNILKNYKFDYINNKIEAYELENSLKRINLKVFTNTYNIDNITECINGKVWVKKYGAMSGEDCKWIEK